MSRKRLLILILTLAAVVVLGIVLWLSLRPGVSPLSSPEDAKIGAGDKKTDKELILEAFSEEHQKSFEELRMIFDELTPTHASGSVSPPDEEGERWWLAAKTGNEWKIVADGDGAVPCAAVEPYDFPTYIVSECYSEETGGMVSLDDSPAGDENGEDSNGDSGVSDSNGDTDSVPTPTPTPTPAATPTPTQDACPCPDTVDPVCGEDGKTYTNICYAMCERVAVDHYGQCTEPSPSPTPRIII